MTNEKGWLTKEEAYATGLPIFIKSDSQKTGYWTSKPYDHAVLMTRTRCKQLKMPALRNGEAAVAYRYAQGAMSSHRYVPLYDRTDVFEVGELPYSILQDGELMDKAEGHQSTE